MLQDGMFVAPVHPLDDSNPNGTRSVSSNAAAAWDQPAAGSGGGAAAVLPLPLPGRLAAGSAAGSGHSSDEALYALDPGLRPAGSISGLSIGRAVTAARIFGSEEQPRGAFHDGGGGTQPEAPPPTLPGWVGGLHVGLHPPPPLPFSPAEVPDAHADVGGGAAVMGARAWGRGCGPGRGRKSVGVASAGAVDQGPGQRLGGTHDVIGPHIIAAVDTEGGAIYPPTGFYHDGSFCAGAGILNPQHFTPGTVMGPEGLINPQSVTPPVGFYPGHVNFSMGMGMGTISGGLIPEGTVHRATNPAHSNVGFGGQGSAGGGGGDDGDDGEGGSSKSEGAGGGGGRGRGGGGRGRSGRVGVGGRWGGRRRGRGRGRGRGGGRGRRAADAAVENVGIEAAGGEEGAAGERGEGEDQSCTEHQLRASQDGGQQGRLAPDGNGGGAGRGRGRDSSRARAKGLSDGGAAAAALAAAATTANAKPESGADDSLVGFTDLIGGRPGRRRVSKMEAVMYDLVRASQVVLPETRRGPVEFELLPPYSADLVSEHKVRFQESLQLLKDTFPKNAQQIKQSVRRDCSTGVRNETCMVAGLWVGDERLACASLLRLNEEHNGQYLHGQILYHATKEGLRRNSLGRLLVACILRAMVETGLQYATVVIGRGEGAKAFWTSMGFRTVTAADGNVAKRIVICSQEQAPRDDVWLATLAHDTTTRGAALQPYSQTDGFGADGEGAAEAQLTSPQQRQAQAALALAIKREQEALQIVKFRLDGGGRPRPVAPPPPPPPPRRPKGPRASRVHQAPDDSVEAVDAVGTINAFDIAAASAAANAAAAAVQRRRRILAAAAAAGAGPAAARGAAAWLDLFSVTRRVRASAAFANPRRSFAEVALPSPEGAMVAADPSLLPSRSWRLEAATAAATSGGGSGSDPLIYWVRAGSQCSDLNLGVRACREVFPRQTETALLEGRRQPVRLTVCVPGSALHRAVDCFLSVSSSGNYQLNGLGGLLRELGVRPRGWVRLMQASDGSPMLVPSNDTATDATAVAATMAVAPAASAGLPAAAAAVTRYAGPSQIQLTSASIWSDAISVPNAVVDGLLGRDGGGGGDGAHQRQQQVRAIPVKVYVWGGIFRTSDATLCRYGTAESGTWKLCGLQPWLRYRDALPGDVLALAVRTTADADVEVLVKLWHGAAGKQLASAAVAAEAWTGATGGGSCVRKRPRSEVAAVKVAAADYDATLLSKLQRQEGAWRRVSTGSVAAVAMAGGGGAVGTASQLTDFGPLCTFQLTKSHFTSVYMATYIPAQVASNLLRPLLQPPSGPGGSGRASVDLGASDSRTGAIHPRSGTVPESLPVWMMGTTDGGSSGAVTLMPTEADMRWYSSCNTWRIRKLVPLLIAAGAQPGSVLGLCLAKLTDAAAEATEPGFGAGYTESSRLVVVISVRNDAEADSEPATAAMTTWDVKLEEEGTWHGAEADMAMNGTPADIQHLRSPAPPALRRRGSATHALGRPSTSLIGPGGSEDAASPEVNASRSAGSGGRGHKRGGRGGRSRGRAHSQGCGAYEDHPGDLDVGDAVADRSEGAGDSPMAGVKRKPREDLAWEDWRRRPPVQRLAVVETLLGAIRAELPLPPPPPSGTIRSTAVEGLAAVLLQRLGLAASLQGTPYRCLVTRLSCLGAAAVVATHHWAGVGLVAQGEVHGALLRVACCAPLQGLKLQLRVRDRHVGNPEQVLQQPTTWGDVTVDALFGELLDTVNSADEDSLRAISEWLVHLAAEDSHAEVSLMLQQPAMRTHTSSGATAAVTVAATAPVAELEATVQPHRLATDAAACAAEAAAAAALQLRIQLASAAYEWQLLSLRPLGQALPLVASPDDAQYDARQRNPETQQQQFDVQTQRQLPQQQLPHRMEGLVGAAPTAAAEGAEGACASRGKAEWDATATATATATTCASVLSSLF
ncbi:hypothetical protein VaNZ11_012847 [Volvox africanus]|uniref:N-acetyltransferase domain-containing protein n=1 Tax=Volvox africanus TaxID=51714 RepID=A0ABQ5SET9_9CHLO|nr:hypothetical protein VaNZ11_012847 [Volvox africanus]